MTQRKRASKLSVSLCIIFTQRIRIVNLYDFSYFWTLYENETWERKISPPKFSLKPSLKSLMWETFLSHFSYQWKHIQLVIKTNHEFSGVLFSSSFWTNQKHNFCARDGDQIIVFKYTFFGLIVSGRTFLHEKKNL